MEMLVFSTGRHLDPTGASLDSHRVGMSTSSIYKRFAARCLEEARITSDEGMRAFLIEMAQAWQRLADQAGAAEDVQEVPPSDEPDRGD
jgi:hypothetical protein